VTLCVPRDALDAKRATMTRDGEMLRACAPAAPFDARRCCRDAIARRDAAMPDDNDAVTPLYY